MATIFHEVFIAASAREIYTTLTSQEGLSAWWTPGAEARPEVNSIARFPFGDTYFKEMKVNELKPSEYVSWICVTGATEWVGTSISFRLVQGDKKGLLQSYPEIQDQLKQATGTDGTLLIFRHADWKDHTRMFAECNYTWGQFLRSLKLVCETGKGRPWPYQHRNEEIDFGTKE